MNEDITKTVNRIVNQPIPKVKKGNMKGYFLREVTDINGMYIIVRSGESPIEPPSNKYGAFLDKPHISDGYKKLLLSGVKITAKVKLINNKWIALDLFPEEEPEEISQDDEYDPGYDY